MISARSFLADGPADFEYRATARPLMLLTKPKAERTILQVFAFRFEQNGRRAGSFRGVVWKRLMSDSYGPCAETPLSEV